MCTVVVWSADAQSLKSAAVFTEIVNLLPKEGKEVVDKLKSTYKFVISNAKGDKKVTWTLNLKEGNGTIKEGDDGSKADATFQLTDDNFINMATGKVNPQSAFLTGKLKLQGNLQKALAFNTHVFQKHQKRIKETVETMLKSKL